jgi:hypothetical protein
MIINALLAVLLGAALIFVSTLVTGLVAGWLIRSATDAREPAFAGFCVALGWVMGGDWVPHHGTAAEQAAVALGAAAALLLLWRLRVRPEGEAAAEGD